MGSPHWSREEDDTLRAACDAQQEAGRTADTADWQAIATTVKGAPYSRVWGGRSRAGGEVGA